MGLLRLIRRFLRRREAESFDRLALEWGGEVEAARVGSVALQIKDWGERYLNRPLEEAPDDGGLLRAVYRSTSIRFIDNVRFNAVACGSGASNFAGIYGGVPAVLAGLALTTLRIASIWPTLGQTGNKDPQEEDCLQGVFWVAAVGTNRLGERPGLQQRMFQMPADPQRARIANDLLILMSNFLLLHELSHIARGHLDFRHQQGKPMAIFEATSDATSADWRLLQWMELDADRIAVWLLLDAFDWKKSWEPTPIPDVRSKDLYGPLEALRLVYVALGLVFTIFDRREEIVGEHRGRTHPHPAIRLAHAYERSIEFLLHVHDAPSELCSQIMGEALLDIDQVSRIVGRNLVSYALQDSNLISSELKQIQSALHVQDLAPAWAALRQRVTAA